MFKLLFTGLIIYFLYRYMSKPGKIGSGRKQKIDPLDRTYDDTEGEYTDYEEIK